MKLSTLAKNLSKSTENIVSLVVDAIFKACLNSNTELLVPFYMVSEKDLAYLKSEGFKVEKQAKGVLIKWG